MCTPVDEVSVEYHQALRLTTIQGYILSSLSDGFAVYNTSTRTRDPPSFLMQQTLAGYDAELASASMGNREVPAVTVSSIKDLSNAVYISVQSPSSTPGEIQIFRSLLFTPEESKPFNMMRVPMYVIFVCRCGSILVSFFHFVLFLS